MGTLYKYFPDVETILVAWHEQQVRAHLHHLATVRDQHPEPHDQLEAVLRAYAALLHERHNGELAALAHSGDASLLHQGRHLDHAQQHLTGLIADLIGHAAQTGHLRGDVAPQELARYCLHALTAAGVRVPINHPGWSCGVVVLVECPAESVSSMDFETSDLCWFLEWEGEWSERSGLAHGPVGPVRVVEGLELPERV